MDFLLMEKLAIVYPNFDYYFSKDVFAERRKSASGLHIQVEEVVYKGVKICPYQECYKKFNKQSNLEAHLKSHVSQLFSHNSFLAKLSPF